MKFARFLAQGKAVYGIVEGDKVTQLSGSPFTRYQPTKQVHKLSQVRLLAPCTPGKVLAMALNYRTHLGAHQAPKRPEPFWKGSNCIIGPEEPIVMPKNAGRVDEEGELVAVMGKRCKGVSKEEALKYVLGYTCGHDVSARDWQGGPDKDIQWWRAKGADTFGPMGPYLVTDFDPSRFELSVRVNGKEVQHGKAQELIFDIPTIISFISQTVTLEPGDVIFSGTPGSTTALKAGDVVEIDISGLGVLRNPVKAE